MCIRTTALLEMNINNKSNNNKKEKNIYHPRTIRYKRTKIHARLDRRAAAADDDDNNGCESECDGIIFNMSKDNVNEQHRQNRKK